MRFNLSSSYRHWIDGFRLAKKTNKMNDLKLHFGCGNDKKIGWLNLDVNNNADFWVDVRNPVNIKSLTSKFIYSSHMVEHLEHHELLFHLKECFRLLKGDGILRLCIPDFEVFIRKYNDNNFLEKYRWLVPGEKFDLPDDYICYMDLMNRAFYEFGQHRMAFNYEKIRKLLLYVGFNDDNIMRVEYDKNIDLESRRDASFYVIAIKKLAN